MINPIKAIVVEKGEATEEVVRTYTLIPEIKVTETALNDPTLLPPMTMKDLIDMLATLPGAILQEDEEETQA
jgi:hypothetical protein